MAALCSIIQKCINKEQPEILPDYTLYTYWNVILTTTQLSTIQSIYYNYVAYINVHFFGKVSITDKFGYIKSNVLDNAFIPNELKTEFLTVFAKIQKTYYGFSRLAHIYKLKRAKLVINTDLYLNTIDQTQDNVITIYQNKSKYLFVIGDLIRILNNNLSHAPSFFVSPLLTKNPYNNIKFNRTILYNIYFFIKFKNGMVMPELFQRYFISNFNIKQFKKDNECLIRDYAIKSFVFTSSSEILFPVIGYMFQKFKEDVRNIYIHKDFPRDKLVNIMRPYLHLYYIHKYAIYGTMKKYDAYNLLKKKLRLFARFNSKFGRKYIHFLNTDISTPFPEPRQRIKRPYKISFNDSHINFYKEYNEYDFSGYVEDYDLILLNRHLNYRIINIFNNNEDSDDSSI
jgi:hypothetical protein